MAGFSSRSNLIEQIVNNGEVETFTFYKSAPTTSTTVATGSWQNLWSGAGFPTAGQAPSATPTTPGATASDSNETSQIAGAMWFASESPKQKHILSFGASSTHNCTLMLYDRLAAVGTGSLTNTATTRTVTNTAITRYVSGEDAMQNEVWLELGVTSTTAGIIRLNNYTSADGTTVTDGANVTAPSATTNANTWMQLPLGSTKRGVSAITSVLTGGTAFSSTTSATVSIIRPLAKIPLVANVWNEISFVDDILKMPRIYDGASLGLAIFAPSNVAATVWGTLVVGVG